MRAFIILFLLPINIIGQTRYIDNVFSSVSVLTYEYSQKEGESLKLDFYNPKNDSLRSRPLLVFMHGGGFAIGVRNDEEIVKLATSFAKKGYPVASISYRLSRKGKGFNCNTPVKDKMDAFKLGGEDLLDAVCFIIDRKEEFNIDPSKIILAGSSAGAEAILMSTYNRDLFFKGNLRYEAVKPAAIVSLAGALTNLELITSKNNYPGIFFHGTEDPLVPYQTAPHHFCDDKKAGYLILHGSKSITDKLKSLDTSYLLYTIEGGKHDIFEITENKIAVIKDFLNEVVIKEKKYQKSLSK